jgi:feruloyl esterase
MVGTDTPCGTITATDADVIRRIWQGARDTSDRFLWYGLEPGAPFTGLANTAQSPDGSTSGAPFPIATDWIRFFLLQDPEWDWRTATPEQFDQWFQQSVEQYTHVLGTDDPDLSDFRDAGGKLLIWHGWADQLIFPRQAIDYYERVERAMGGPERTGQFARLFMAPGVEHCRGGAGPSEFDGLGPLVQWVEHATAPESVVAAHRTNGVVDRTRPLCRYPMVARWSGQGSTDDAANFSCTRARRRRRLAPDAP